MRSDIMSQPMRLGPDELAIFEGIHALNDIIVGKNPHAFKLYIAARVSRLADGVRRIRRRPGAGAGAPRPLPQVRRADRGYG